MDYEILRVDGSEGYVVRSVDAPDTLLELPTVRDLLLLRKRLDQFVNDPEADGNIKLKNTQPAASTLVDADAISVAQALKIIEAAGHTIPKSTLTSAVYRGSIPGSHQRGSRWYVPRAAFEEWFQHWISTH